jgi:hypothetical protein
VQPNGMPRRLRLSRDPTTAAYRIVAPHPATHQLTVAVVAPRAADVDLWLDTGSGSPCRCRAARAMRPGAGQATG